MKCTFNDERVNPWEITSVDLEGVFHWSTWLAWSYLRPKTDTFTLALKITHPETCTFTNTHAHEHWRTLTSTHCRLSVIHNRKLSLPLSHYIHTHSDTHTHTHTHILFAGNQYFRYGLHWCVHVESVYLIDRAEHAGLRFTARAFGLVRL